MHGLERDWKERVQFFHVNFRSASGKELGRRFGIEHLPALVLLDGAGSVRAKLGLGQNLRRQMESHIAALFPGQ